MRNWWWTILGEDNFYQATIWHYILFLNFGFTFSVDCLTVLFLLVIPIWHFIFSIELYLNMVYVFNILYVTNLIESWDNYRDLFSGAGNYSHSLRSFLYNWTFVNSHEIIFDHVSILFAVLLHLYDNSWYLFLF